VTRRDPNNQHADHKWSLAWERKDRALESTYQNMLAGHAWSLHQFRVTMATDSSMSRLIQWIVLPSGLWFATA